MVDDVVEAATQASDGCGTKKQALEWSVHIYRFKPQYRTRNTEKFDYLTLLFVRSTQFLEFGK